MDFESDRIVLVGGIPEPVGGVTTYIYRLVRREKKKVEAVIDLYPREKKKDISPVRHVILSRFAGASLFLFLLKNRTDVYFNFSGVSGLLLIAFLPKRIGVKWFLTLHNGGIEAQLEKSFLIRLFSAFGVKRLDGIGYLSSSQRLAYESLGVLSDVLTRISSFIPVSPSDVAPVDASRYPDIFSFVQNRTPYFIISGYPTKIYQHLEVLDLFERLWAAGKKMRLVGFFYGDDSDGLLNSLRERFDENGNALFFWGAESEDFLSALSSSSGYLRMNKVDSYGVAVAEAVTLGVPCVATNVCERYPGASLLNPDDFSGLEDFILQLIGEDQ